MWWLWIIIVLVILCIAATFGIFIFTFFNPPKLRKDDYFLPEGHTAEPYKDKIYELINKAKELPCEEVHVKSFDGYKLRGRYYHSAEVAPLIICCHGYRSTAFKDFSGGLLYLHERGFNVLLIDERAHGESEGSVITFGINERQDVLEWARWARKRFGPVPMYLFGISMGAATVLLASELDFPNNLRGIIADCPYSSPRKIIVNTAAGMHIPAWTLIFARIGARLLGGFKLSDIDASDCVKNTKVPILIIHGDADSFVPPYMSEGPAEANPEMVKRITIKGADHALSFIVDPEKYKAAVEEFFARTMKIDTLKEAEEE